MPDWSAQNDVLADENGRTVVAILCITERVIADSGKVSGTVAINLAIFMGEVYIGSIVICLMDRKAAGIRVMPMESAAWCREKRLRQMRARAPIIQYGWEYARLKTTGEIGTIIGIDQSCCDEILQDLVLVCIGKPCTMLNTRVRISNCVECFPAKVTILNPLGLID